MSLRELIGLDSFLDPLHASFNISLELEVGSRRFLLEIGIEGQRFRMLAPWNFYDPPPGTGAQKFNG